MNDLGQTILSEVLWVVIVIGFVILIVAGLEPDKPLSGGIPGHLDLHEMHHTPPPEGLLGRFGEIGGWIFFALASLSLIFILIWILQTHH